MKSTLLKPLYSQAVRGLPIIGTPTDVAERYADRGTSLHERADALASLYTGLCASTGFVCGLGGFLTLPITLPTNLAGVAMLQLHMTAAIAVLGGRNPDDAPTRDRCIDCLLGTYEDGAERDETQEVVDRSAVKVAERGIRFLAEQSLRLASSGGKWVAKRVVTSRLPRRGLPLLGGVIGGASDAFSTRTVTDAAKHTFLGPAAVMPRTVADLPPSS